MRADALDDRIQYFPLTMSSHRDKELFSIMLSDGSSAASDQEITTPYFYSTRFIASGATAEFTATERSVFFRFAFPKATGSLMLANRNSGNLTLRDGHIVEGEEQFNGMKAYVYGVFGNPVHVAAKRVDEKDHLLISAATKELEFRYGISFISTDHAKANLEQEIASASFEQVKASDRLRWDGTLGRISVQGGTEAHKASQKNNLQQRRDQLEKRDPVPRSVHTR